MNSRHVFLALGLAACAAPFTLCAAAPAANLLTHNPSFEAPGGGGGHGLSTSVPDWEVDYFAYDGFGVQDGAGADGRRALSLNHGARVTTAPADRPAVQPGQVYRMAFDAKKPSDGDPDACVGFSPSVLFYDAGGTLLKEAKFPDVENGGGAWPWQHFAFTTIAPAGAAKVAVQVILSRGAWPHQDTRVGLVDNFSLSAVPEAKDTVAVRLAPHALEPGKTAVLTVKYTVTAARDVLVRLVNADKVVSGARASVSTGRGVVTLRVPVPPAAPQSDTYHWDIALAPPGGKAARADAAVPGVFVNETLRGAGTIGADNPFLLYAGRWDRTKPAVPVCYWGGSHLETRFRGTSVAARFVPDGGEFVAVVDGDEDHLVKFTVKNGMGTIATGLASGDHTLLLMKNTETGTPVTFQGLTLDANCGLLRPEPLPMRRIEWYGDSITSGGQPDPLVPHPDPGEDAQYAGNFYRNFTGYTSRALGADYRSASKGGTGVAGSWVFKYTLRDYWNLWDFDGYDPAKARKYDLTQWQPQAVVVSIGHNDRFRAPSKDAWIKSYAEFIHSVRRAYPNANIFCTNTAMSSDPSWWKPAVLPLLAQDPKLHFQMFDPDQGHGGHPRLQDHRDMAYGNEHWNGLVDWIGDTLGW